MWSVYVRACMSQAHVEHVGKVTHVSGYIHLHFRQDLHVLTDSCHSLRAGTKQVEKLPSANPTVLFWLSAQIEELCERSETSVRRFRGKRSIFGDITGLIGAVAGGTALWQVHTVARRMSRAEARLTKTLYVLDRHEHRLGELATDVRHLNTSLSLLLTHDKANMLRQEAHVVESALARSVILFETRLNNFASILDTVSAGTAGYHLLTGVDLDLANARCQDMAKKLGATLAFPDPMSLPRMPVTFSIDQKAVLAVTVHVPLALQPSELYEVTLLPRLVQEPQGRAIVVPGQSDGLLLEGTHGVQELDWEDLERCHKVREHFICAGATRWYEPRSTCLGAMKLAAWTEGRHLCRWKVLSPGSTWAAAKGPRAWLAATEEVSTRITCPNKTVRTVAVKGVLDLVLQPCALSAPGVTLTATPFHVDVTAKLHFSAGIPKDSVKVWFPNHTMEDLDRAVRELASVHLTKDPEVREVLRALHRSEQARSSKLALGAVAAAVGMGLLAGLGLCTYVWYLRRRFLCRFLYETVRPHQAQSKTSDVQTLEQACYAQAQELRVLRHRLAEGQHNEKV